MASNKDYDDLLQSFMNNSAKAYDEDKIAHEEKRTIFLHHTAFLRPAKIPRKSSAAEKLKISWLQKMHPSERKENPRTKLLPKKGFPLSAEFCWEW